MFFIFAIAIATLLVPPLLLLTYCPYYYYYYPGCEPLIIPVTALAIYNVTLVINPLLSYTTTTIDRDIAY